MEAKRFVVDASVAAKWLLEKDEPDVELAAQRHHMSVAGEVELHAPSVFSYEVGHLLVAATRRQPPRLQGDEAVECIRKLFSLPIRIHPPCEEEAAAAMTMAVRFFKSFYDMTYLHLAEKLDCKLCTADERAATSTDPDFPSHRIVLLSQLRRA